jgi:hypothetical protein
VDNSDASPIAPIYHVGILVANIEHAMARFSSSLDLTFAPIRATRSAQLRGLVDEGYDVRWAVSRHGPPYIELIEGQGDGFFSLAGVERLHHIGRWAPSNHIGAAGSPVGEAITITTPGLDGANVWMADPKRFHGIWIEMIDTARRGEFHKWLASPG